jgi:nicotinamidase-related amidase
MSYCLVIVDMQDQFSASKGEAVRKACVREIKSAMKNDATIVFVKYANYGPTIPLLTDLVKKTKYRKAHTVLKHANGGGDVIAKYLRDKHLTRANLRVCGVNTNYCVLATVQGMNTHLKNSNLHVVADACATNGGATGHKYGLDAMRKLANVKILREKK